MQSIEEVVAQCLIQQKKTIACAESCSGGLLVNRFTNIPGCSAFLKESVVTYSNESKINTLGVTTDTIQKYGAVSKQTAQEMARGIRIKTNSDIGIAITGIAGPTGDTFKKPIGLVYIPYNDREENSIVEKHIFTDNRERHKLRSTQAALYLIYRYVCECSEK
ncbi:MAG TPA: CinA family protein [Planctomycetota bacterium]|nr:CinA family protein [Planctomycetota bacterium]